LRITAACNTGMGNNLRHKAVTLQEGDSWPPFAARRKTKGLRQLGMPRGTWSSVLSDG
jgi:hypothetical protein